MAFRPNRVLPKFADLKTILSQSKNTDDPLYQVIQEIIERLSAFQFDIGTLSSDTGTGGGGGGGTGNPVDASYFTKQDETLALPNSLQLLTRYGLKADNTVAHKQTIDLDLEYLGNYASGPLYSDGDVVIAADGIAYLCVRPTTTAPVPWPGIGVSTVVGPPGPQGPKGDTGPPSPAVDALYWLVQAHAALPNGRPVSGTGYVRSTVGEPSVVATIPLTDTTGILPDNRLTSNVALKNIDNHFVPQTLAAGTTVLGAGSVFAFVDLNAAVDGKVWRLITDGPGNMYLQGLNDAQTAVTQNFAFNRNGFLAASGFVGDGANLTNLNASNLATGLVNPARLGSGTANSNTVLFGDNVWRPVQGTFPSGLIVISDTPCPVGWTRVNWDGFFIRSGPVIGATGGAATHTHGLGTLATNPHSHGGQTGNVNIGVTVTGTTGNGGIHQHSVDVDGSGSTGAGNAQTMNVDAGSSGVMSRQEHAHSFSVHSSGSTNNAGDHNHSFSGSGSGNGVGSIASESVGMQGAVAAASNLPPYLDIFFCRKD